MPYPSTIRAFVVADDCDMRDLLKRILENRGYEVLTYSSPIVCSICPCLSFQRCADILISDHSLFQYTSLDLAKHQTKVGCAIPNVALLSSNWAWWDAQRIQDLGYQFFPKPFELEEMDQWLADCERRLTPNRVLDSFFQQQQQTRPDNQDQA